MKSIITGSQVNGSHHAASAARVTRTGAIIAGSTEVRLASDNDDVEAAQELRYRVFYEEMGAKPSSETADLRLDRDAFDAAAEHLLVIDHSLGGAVVGTYRLMRGRFSKHGGGYYTSGEYDISKLTEFQGEILELGRSCVDPRYRTRATMSLLWQGIAAYVFEHDIQLMFGCASLPGCDPSAHAEALSYLHHFHRAPRALRPHALAARYIDMNMALAHKIDRKHALTHLPPLIKGYLRLGGWVGEGAVIDPQFNTTDICIVLKMESLASKYFRHYRRTLIGARLQ
jgi:L-ornithine Nalpha-acyltransferase